MQDTLHQLAWVALGSALGGPARFFLSGLVGRRVGETFAWGTLTVNVTGCFAIGLLAAAASVDSLLPLASFWPLAVTGFLGGYTTVSSFSLQTLAMVRDGEILLAGANVLLSLGLCLAAVALGFAAGAALFGTGTP